jgi:hypothetical protein
MPAKNPIESHAFETPDDIPNVFTQDWKYKYELVNRAKI